MCHSRYPMAPLEVLYSFRCHPPPMDPLLEDDLSRSKWTGLLWLPWRDPSVSKLGTPGSSLLLVASIFLYSSGFVVVSTSLERLGVAMPAGDFLKIQYVYVGVFASAFVAFIFGASYLVFHLLETRSYGTVAPRKEIPRLSVLAMCMVAIGLYLQVKPDCNRSEEHTSELPS